MRRSREAPPGGYGSWKDFFRAKKQRKERNADYVLERLEAQKESEAYMKNIVEDVSQEVQHEISTLSIAIPGSILDNAQSPELRTYLAGQIARAACVFKVDEIVVYDDVGVQNSVQVKTMPGISDDGEVHQTRRCCAQLARILQYLECPQYLRKDFFPKCKDLEYAGLLNPLDAPHHMRQQDECRFREGIVLKIPAKNGSYVNVGLLDKVKIDKILQPGLRVTVEMLPPPCETSKRLFGRVVAPSVPHQVTGEYWGYSVRLAKSLSAVLTECPYKEGYDVSIGTSERGDPVETVSFPHHKHALVVFGGLAGLEAALEADEVLTETNPAFLFDHYLNSCAGQGSRTIRTEEAVLITLAELRTKMKKVWSAPPTSLKNGNTQEEIKCINEDVSDAGDKHVVNNDLCSSKNYVESNSNSYNQEYLDRQPHDAPEGKEELDMVSIVKSKKKKTKSLNDKGKDASISKRKRKNNFDIVSIVDNDELLADVSHDSTSEKKTKKCTGKVAKPFANNMVGNLQQKYGKQSNSCESDNMNNTLNQTQERIRTKKRVKL